MFNHLATEFPLLQSNIQIWCSGPSFNCNHFSLFILANSPIFLGAGGFSQIKEYRYWNAETKSLDFEGMIEDLQVSVKKLL